MKYLLNPSTDPYFNMALDEYCLEHIRSEEPYFYLWRNAPSVIIGLNQNAYGEVNLPFLEEHGILLVRRMTGGGAVYHDLQNLNYTIIGKAPSPQPVADALRSLGVDAVLTGRNDIFVDGRKVSGYARRVSHGQEIIHGTLMYDVDLDTLGKALDVPGSKLSSKGIASVRSRVCNLKECLKDIPSVKALQGRLQDILSKGDGEITLSAAQKEEVRDLAQGKFATWEFIYGHSKEADFVREAHLPCGTVQVRLTLDKGRIRGISFSGDYLFDEPPGALASSLEGLRFDRAALTPVVNGAGISRYFPGVTTEQFLSLLFPSSIIHPISPEE